MPTPITIQPIVAGVMISAIMAIGAWAFHIKDVLIKHNDEIDRLKEREIESKANQAKTTEVMNTIMIKLAGMETGISHINDSINRILDERNEKRS